MNTDTKNLTVMRCSTCGVVLGLTGLQRLQGVQHSGLTWCSEECAATPISQNEERDTTICELFLAGQNISAIARETDTNRAHAQQVLDRRGITRYYPAKNPSTTKNGQGS